MPRTSPPESFLAANSSLLTNSTLLRDSTENLTNLVNIYYTPLLIVLGVLGNIVSTYVFFKSKLQLQSTSQYLSALAISDTIFLIQLLPPWLNAEQYAGIFHRHGFCELFIYCTYVTCFLSAWLVVAFTVERFVAVVYPLRRSAVCTVARARYVIATLVVTALLVNIPVLRYVAPTSNDCSVDFAYLTHAARFNLVDTALSFMVPLAMIVFLNAWIMIVVWRLERTRHRMIKDETPVATPGGRARASCTRPSSQHRVTKMLLTVSTVFVMLNFPAYTMRTLAYAYDMTVSDFSGGWATMQQLAQMLFNTNFGINFILYCLSGQNFRRELVQVIPWIRRRRVTAARAAAFAQHDRASSVSTGSGSNNTEARTIYGPARHVYDGYGGGNGREPFCGHATIVASAPGLSRATTAKKCSAAPKYRYGTSNYHPRRTNGVLRPAITSIRSGSNRPVSTIRCATGPIRGGTTCGFYELGSRSGAAQPGPYAGTLAECQCASNLCAASGVCGMLRYSEHDARQEPRHTRQGSFIKRWKFDNSRQRQTPTIEMQELGHRNGDL